MRENASAAISVLADKVGETFKPYLKNTVKTLTTALEDKELVWNVKGELVETIAMVSCAVSKETFLAELDIGELIGPMIHIHNTMMVQRDPTR